jgi:hypothetical protein
MRKWRAGTRKVCRIGRNLGERLVAVPNAIPNVIAVACPQRPQKSVAGPNAI